MPIDTTPIAQSIRDAAYNNGAAVPSWSEKFACWSTESALIRAQHAHTMDLPFADAERTKIDLFPSQNPQAPCLVYFHGGYWQRNSRDMFAVLSEGVAAHGWSVAIPGYTLAPEASLGDIVDECGLALDWLAEQGPQHGITGPLVVAGWSAGGHLAALALSHAAVIAGVAISGIFELAPLQDTYLNDNLKLKSSEIQNLSPLRRPVVMKPLHVIYGAKELPQLVANSAAFHALRVRVGAAGHLIEVADSDHFSVLDTLRSPTGIITETLLSLV